MGRIGETIKLVCPVSGFPDIMVEWYKDGEQVDEYTWQGYRIGKKSLKIRNANVDDTGVFVCKAINGFGSEQVRIELVVVGE